MPVARIRLLEADPDLGRFLDDDDLAEARQLVLPVVRFSGDDDASLEARFDEWGAFAALVLEGMVLEQLQIGDQSGLRLLGPADIVSRAPGSHSSLVDSLSVRVLAGTRLALLGPDFVLGIRRWPGLIKGLHERLAQQTDRVATQLVICQLPRVDQRLLALMWLLAESWGRVTPAGTTVPLKLTHDALGALIGARRPTVTLALRELSERGAILRQDTGWLLLEPSPGNDGPDRAAAEPGDHRRRRTQMASSASREPFAHYERCHDRADAPPGQPASAP